MQNSLHDVYLQTMMLMRKRFDKINAEREHTIDVFLKAEACALQGRKIIEGIAHWCVIALSKGIGRASRSFTHGWNAEKILGVLSKNQYESVFPSPSIMRGSSSTELAMHGTSITVEGVPDRRIVRAELVRMYNRLHVWNHEINPFKYPDGQLDFLTMHEQRLWDDLIVLWKFIEKHAVSLNGQMFFCVLKDNIDGNVKLLSLS